MFTEVKETFFLSIILFLLLSNKV